jgi:hypothetical protein
MNSNNLLAVELENENDAARESFSISVFPKFTSVEAAAQATTIRIYSNDHHVKARDSALGAAGDRHMHCSYHIRSRHIHGIDAGIFASADRCATQRHKVRMPFGL